MSDSYSGLQLANGRSDWPVGGPIGQLEVRLASWRLPYSGREILVNRRDQLYGLFAEIGVRLPSPDYKKSLGTIYLEATKALIEKETSLRILLLVTGLPNSDIEAPSWVPDFSNDLPPYSVFEQTDIRATLDTTAIYTFASSGQKLFLRGRIIDRISWSSSLQIWHPDHVLRPSEDILVEALRSGPSAQVKTIHALQDWALKARMVTPRLNGQVWEEISLIL